MSVAGNLQYAALDSRKEASAALEYTQKSKDPAVKQTLPRGAIQLARTKREKMEGAATKQRRRDLHAPIKSSWRGLESQNHLSIMSQACIVAKSEEINSKNHAVSTDSLSKQNKSDSKPQAEENNLSASNNNKDGAQLLAIQEYLDSSLAAFPSIAQDHLISSKNRFGIAELALQAQRSTQHALSEIDSATLSPMLQQNTVTNNQSSESLGPRRLSEIVAEDEANEGHILLSPEASKHTLKEHSLENNKSAKPPSPEKDTLFGTPSNMTRTSDIPQEAPSSLSMHGVSTNGVVAMRGHAVATMSVVEREAGKHEAELAKVKLQLAEERKCVERALDSLRSAQSRAEELDKELEDEKKRHILSVETHKREVEALKWTDSRMLSLQEECDRLRTRISIFSQFQPLFEQLTKLAPDMSTPQQILAKLESLQFSAANTHSQLIIAEERNVEAKNEHDRARSKLENDLRLAIASKTEMERQLAKTSNDLATALHRESALYEQFKALQSKHSSVFFAVANLFDKWGDAEEEVHSVKKKTRNVSGNTLAQSISVGVDKSDILQVVGALDSLLVRCRPSLAGEKLKEVQGLCDTLWRTHLTKECKGAEVENAAGDCSGTIELASRLIDSLLLQRSQQSRNAAKMEKSIKELHQELERWKRSSAAAISKSRSNTSKATRKYPKDSSAQTDIRMLEQWAMLKFGPVNKVEETSAETGQEGIGMADGFGTNDANDKRIQNSSPEDSVAQDKTEVKEVEMARKDHYVNVDSLRPLSATGIQEQKSNYDASRDKFWQPNRPKSAMGSASRSRKPPSMQYLDVGNNAPGGLVITLASLSRHVRRDNMPRGAGKPSLTNSGAAVRTNVPVGSGFKASYVTGSHPKWVDRFKNNC